MAFPGKSRVHPAVYAGLGLLLLALIAGSALLVRWHKRREAKEEFIHHYQGLMRSSVQTFYFGTGTLPQDATELVASNVRALRSPDVITQWSNHDLVSNKIDTRTATPFEREMFAEALRECQPLVPQWERELTAARQPLSDRQGDLAAQLELFGEPSFKNLAGVKFLEDLAREHQLSDVTFYAFFDAAHHYKAARKSKLSPQALEPYRTAFEKAKQAMLEGAAGSAKP